MFTRRLLAAAAVATALVTLTSCKGEDDPKSASPEASASSAAPTASGPTDPATAPSSSASASASPSKDLPLDPEPSSDCTPRQLAKGHRMVQITTAPSGGALLAQEAKFGCDPNGGGYAGTGKAARFRLASGATAELATGAVDHQKVTVAQLTEHLNACLRNETVKQPFTCSRNIYEITVNGSGDISHLTEVWHS